MAKASVFPEPVGDCAIRVLAGEAIRQGGGLDRVGLGDTKPAYAGDEVGADAQG